VVTPQVHIRTCGFYVCVWTLFENKLYYYVYQPSQMLSVLKKYI